ncbi:MAG: glycosyltransferase [Dongiaceae bacterium]
MTRVFFYVQSLLGVGHLSRAAAIARALDDAGLAVTFVSGGAPAPALDLGRATSVQLPPALAGDASFARIVDADGRPIDDDWRARRRALLLDAFARADPRLVLIELYPFGRRAFRFELLPLLEAMIGRRPRPAVACSLRDILVGKRDPARASETVSIVRRCFDRVLVHGDPRLIRLEATFPAAAEIADLVRYTGYVVRAAAPGAGGAGQGEVLVSAGGGAVGGPLLRAALAARPLTRLAAAPWRLIGGINMPEAELASLGRAAPRGVAVERFRDDFPTLLRNCRLSVSQGGYNTVMEILAARTRAVVVPFADGAETEQSLRARLLAERGLLTVAETPEAAPLAAAIDAALERAPPVSDIHLNGAARTAEIAAELVGRR